MKARLYQSTTGVFCASLTVTQVAELRKADARGRTIEAEITIDRVSLPDGYAWAGSDIVCPLIDARWSVETWLAANKACPSIAARGTRVVPSFVIDAFRAEGLI